jgi:hypothetical protein
VACHAGAGGGDPDRPDRHARGHLAARLLDQPAHPACPAAGHRSGGGRCHRRAGKHPATAQPAPAPTSGRGHRHARGVLRHRGHHRHTGVGVRADLFPAVRRGSPVRRIRFRDGDLGGDLFFRRTFAWPDDRGAAARRPGAGPAWTRAGRRGRPQPGAVPPPHRTCTRSRLVAARPVPGHRCPGRLGLHPVAQRAHARGRPRRARGAPGRPRRRGSVLRGSPA